MTALTSVVNASSFLPSLYAFYNFTSSTNSFASSQSANRSTSSSPEQTTNATEVPFNATDYDTTFVDVTTSASFHNMTSLSTSSPSFSTSSSSSASYSTNSRLSTTTTITGIAYPETFPFSADAAELFTTDENYVTSGFFHSTTHAQSVYTTQTMMRVGSYEAVTSSTEFAGLQQLDALAGGHYYAAGIVVGTLAVLFILSAFGLLFCRRRLQTYHSLPSGGGGSTRNYDYLYRPLNKAGRLNEEYDHTFVGVSIPLLQEVTIV